ncbi:hypothetical protein CKO42_08060 [Lamprobacter modestohalophilus]|uniref:Uncharacterized protein n=1 Tax=Lamprobacter modestohalophilus TaxID=1064514 RepID=A0A9X1B498_9GAMM|nr:hypothetical protein [Lamprobacter modestohalophilus]MBK1618392.1 hypothetical protein [Lamprobacter modestohalophilus]
MRHLTRPTRWPMLLAVTIIAIVAAPAAAFANACTKLDKAACDRQATCTWVAAYKRMDGVKVSGFCHPRDRRDKPQQ